MIAPVPVHCFSITFNITTESWEQAAQDRKKWRCLIIIIIIIKSLFIEDYISSPKDQNQLPVFRKQLRKINLKYLIDHKKY